MLCAAGIDVTSIIFSLLKSLAKHYGFDLDTPYKELPKAIQNIVLYGSDEEEISFSYTNERGETHVVVSIPLKGLLPI